jgi:hypothetical protein
MLSINPGSTGPQLCCVICPRPACLSPSPFPRSGRFSRTQVIHVVDIVNVVVFGVVNVVVIHVVTVFGRLHTPQFPVDAYV